MTKANEKAFILDRISNAAYMYVYWKHQPEDAPTTAAARREYTGILAELQKIAEAFGFGEEALNWRVYKIDWYEDLHKALLEAQANKQTA